MENWYTINQVDQIDSPALVFYPERIKQNINVLKKMIGDLVRIRPHVKTHKTKEATYLLLDAGIRQFKCATIAEAEMLAMCQAPDVLLAYQPVGPKISRFIGLIKSYPGTHFSCLIDDLSIAETLSQKAIIEGLKIAVYIDLNVGMNRTGISADQKAVDLYEACNLLEGIEILGLHAYDGHNSDADLNIRCGLARKIYEQVIALKQQLQAKNPRELLIIAGGTPSFPYFAKKEDIVCSPGTFILWDKGYLDKYTEQAFLPAALLVCRIVSRPHDTKICVDLGHKAVSAENELKRRVHFLNAPDLKFVSQSEEHLVLDAGENHPYQIGDVLYGLPVHICPTCALHGKAITIEQGEITGEWEIIARNREINI